MWLLLTVLANIPPGKAKLHAYGTPGIGLVASEKSNAMALFFFLTLKYILYEKIFDNCGLAFGIWHLNEFLPCIGKNRHERAWCKCRYRSTLICKSDKLA